jgi:predicted AAA+ superfamily ATPase
MNQETLLKFNTWWSTGHLPKQFVWPKKRFFFKKVIAHIDNPYILVLTGLRRTGKTVLVLQCIEQLLNQGIPPENILYFSFEDFSEDNLHELIESYKQVTIPKGRVYCFFDEIHYVQNWSNQIKFFYDQKVDMKFLVTGSSSHLLFKATSESLAGRVNILPLSPMNFVEYLHLNGIALEKRPNLGDSHISDIFKKKLALLTFKEQYQQEFQTYLKFGGIPEYLDKSMKIEQWYQFLRQNYLALVLFKDILLNYEIRDSRNLFRLVQYLAATSTTTQSPASIGTNLGIKKDTIDNYIRYLEEAFLIAHAIFFTASPTKALRRNNKTYLTDVGLTQALYSTFASQTEVETSKIIENLIFQELRSFLINQTNAEFPLIHYWKNKYEVDFVVKLKETVLPIEVKYTNQITSREFRGLIEFSNHFNSDSGILITKDVFEIVKPSDNLTIYMIPAIIFLFIL